jgi:hypothetical protein
MVISDSDLTANGSNLLPRTGAASTDQRPRGHRRFQQPRRRLALAGCSLRYLLDEFGGRVDLRRARST